MVRFDVFIKFLMIFYLNLLKNGGFLRFLAEKYAKNQRFSFFFMVEMSVWGWVEYNICIKTNDNYNGVYQTIHNNYFAG